MMNEASSISKLPRGEEFVKQKLHVQNKRQNQFTLLLKVKIKS